MSAAAHKADDLKRNPFEWTGKHAKKNTSVQKAEETQEKKTSHIPLIWKVVGISSGEYALLTNSKSNTVVRVGTDIDKEWKVEKITGACVVCKHISGIVRELAL
jgi:hypothetical protein